MHCTSCGTANFEDARFCFACGEPMRKPSLRRAQVTEVIGGSTDSRVLADGSDPLLVRSASDGVPSSTKRSTPTLDREFKSYWFGYSLAGMCALGVSKAALSLIRNLSTSVPVAETAEKIGAFAGAVTVSAVALALFAYAGCRIAHRNASRTVVYSVTAAFGIGVLLGGFRPIDIVLWMGLCIPATIKFHEFWGRGETS